MQWTTMFTIASTSGTMRKTDDQFDFVETVFKMPGPGLKLSLHHTVRTHLWNHFIASCFPGSSLINLQSASLYQYWLKMSTWKKSPTVGHATENVRRDRKTAGVVLPSEWAKVRVATIHNYDDLARRQCPNESPSIYNAPLCTMRRQVIEIDTQIAVDEGSGYGRGWPAE